MWPARVRAWAFETQRLAGRGHARWNVHNTMLQSYAITLLLQGSLVLAWGAVMLPFLAVHNLMAWWQLTSANYVEHHGLLCAGLPGSTAQAPRYETPQPHQSWNTNHLVTNLVLFHLQRQVRDATVVP